MKNKFPFEHVVKCDTKQVWVTGVSAITVMGLSKLVEQYYPGYKAQIATKEYFEKLKNQQVQS